MGPGHCLLMTGPRVKPRIIIGLGFAIGSELGGLLKG